MNSQNIVSPEQICNALAAIIRVVNNTITAENQSQGREDTRRMGTTMVMAIQVNQRMRNIKRVSVAHEIYIAHVGDSRAYWITPQRCQLLTIDDDIATREVKQGRDVPWHSANRADATALTQALGMKSGELIKPTVQRFLAIEDGILLLCSDGLSDRNLVESSWQDYAKQILHQDIPLTEAVQSWLALAHGQNGDDNISLVLMSCQVSLKRIEVDRSQLVPINNGANADADAEQLPLSSKFGFNRLINLSLFLITGIGLLVAVATAVTFFYPDWLGNWRKQILPNRSPQAHLPTLSAHHSFSKE
jgi:protein phosphatase